MQLHRLFPRLTHLTLDYHAEKQVYYLLNNLIYLEQLNVRLGKHQYPPNDGLIVRRSRLLTEQFESEMFRTALNGRTWILWIENQIHTCDTSRAKEKRCLIS